LVLFSFKIKRVSPTKVKLLKTGQRVQFKKNPNTKKMLLQFKYQWPYLNSAVSSNCANLCTNP